MQDGKYGFRVRDFFTSQEGRLSLKLVSFQTARLTASAGVADYIEEFEWDQQKTKPSVKSSKEL